MVKSLRRTGRPLAAVIDLQADDEELIKRLIRRGETADIPRDDDNPATIMERLRIYHQQTSPLERYYQQRGILHKIDGLGTKEEVFERVKRCIDELRDPPASEKSA